MKFKEKNIQIILVIITVLMTIFRFLLNEKGRISPDSIRFMHFAKVFPVIDNTITPLGYPLSIKFFTFFGFDEFWSSKIVGLAALAFILIFTYRKNFFFREALVTCSLFSLVSLFSFTMSEALILPFVIGFLYISSQIIIGNLEKGKAIFYLTISLILLYNIRYSALFLMGGTGLYGLIFWKKKHASSFIISGILAGIFVVVYKLFFIDYFNENYVKESLEMGLHPTSQLLKELFWGLCTTFNPFIHMANPNGGIINYGIYGLGLVNILLMIYFFIIKPLSETEVYFIFIGIFGIICSFFIQYFYPVNAIDFRLLSAFSLPIWLVYFRKIFQRFEWKTYAIGFLSICSGLFFTLLSKGNYLENRKEVKQFLKNENLENKPIKFYLEATEDLENIQIAELISTVNADLDITFKPSDTLQKNTLTKHKVLQKIKIDKNKYQ